MVDTILPVDLKGAIVRKGTKNIVGPLDLSFGTTGCSVLIGPYGAGKTTFLLLLHVLVRANFGTFNWAAI